MQTLTLESPAKINLMLSVHGPRGDGFHALTSLVAGLHFGDTLHITAHSGGVDRLSCSDPDVPLGADNLILRAAEAFRQRLGGCEYFAFDLDKRIPMGAGLGGGSSNAAVALRGMNEWLGAPLDQAALLELAAALGSDCPFFIDPVPSVMRGRGERIEALPRAQAATLSGQRIVLFRPDFGVNTGWAYGRLAAAAPSFYESEVAAQARVEAFARSGQPGELLFNSFEVPVGQKYLAIPCLLELLREAGHRCLMSGSGSCCFAWVADAAEADAIRRLCQAAWGEGTFFIETSIL